MTEQVMKDLEYKLNEWAKMTAEIEALQALADQRKKIIEEMAEKNEIVLEVDGAKVIQTSTGEYDWAAMARQIKPTKKEVSAHQKIAWNKLVEARFAGRAADLKELKEKFYTPGKQKYQVRKK